MSPPYRQKILSYQIKHFYLFSTGFSRINLLAPGKSYRLVSPVSSFSALAAGTKNSPAFRILLAAAELPDA